LNESEKKTRGSQAHVLLSDEMLQEALREVRFAAHRAFERSASAADREIAWHMLDSASRFERCLRLAVSQGAAASKQIDRELEREGMLERITGYGRRARNRDLGSMPWNKEAS
jgi:hypothetical protein